MYRWVLLEVLDKLAPGSVTWRLANKPPIKMLFRKVENCNQVKRRKLVIRFGYYCMHRAFLWQLMRFSMLQLLKNLRTYGQGKEIMDADILQWANKKVKDTGKSGHMDSFKDKRLSDGIFFLELLSAVEKRVVNWGLVTKGETEEDKKLNATYIISVARKLGCSIFLLPEDILEVNPKMILILTASIIYWSLLQKAKVNEEDRPPDEPTVATEEVEGNPAMDEAATDDGGTVHQMALSLFRTLAAVARNVIIANTFGSAALLVVFLLGGFIMPIGFAFTPVDLLIYCILIEECLKI
ncbi:unnamed protein product [Lactuca virosa]|uniref:Calponin-homology (CH) domain-containing protein n=1 Tax=Lactuca virosa TaxID=75947 RepID=A0AAU9MG86_9ASTR|nr:unnamed protein product [Lactuca virosa]